ncbi:TPA: hypothetical protein RSZ36_003263 [Escherichia coli]|nr:hypothetical protein [Escherichia coli]HDZ3814553.1 hypothetical protein [Escherichia coli]HDZ3848680.1 hypothetical protein [Escherichia coli]HDZ3884275.1 hypothetical protein [Escherichia coli]
MPEAEPDYQMRTGVIAAQQQHNPYRAVATGCHELISDSYAAAFFFGSTFSFRAIPGAY